MHVAIHHRITDPQKWEQGTKNIMTILEQGRLPQGLKALMFLPCVDGRNAGCLWEANSMETLKSFVERESGGGAKNQYFQIKDAQAIELPGQVELSKAA